MIVGWWLYKKMERIGPFQLENILGLPSQFKLIYVQPSRPLPDSLAARLAPHCESIPAGSVIKEKANEWSRETPILLLSKRGFQSAKVAHRLIKMGFINVYVIEGGVIGLQNYFANSESS